MTTDSLEVERIAEQLGPDESMQFLNLTNLCEVNYERFNNLEMSNALAMIEKLSVALAAARNALQPFGDAYRFVHGDPHQHEDNPGFREFLDGNSATPSRYAKDQLLSVGHFRAAALATTGGGQ